MAPQPEHRARVGMVGRAGLERVRRLMPQLADTRLADVPYDLLAGLAVAALAVPQATAYAIVAGVPPAMGLLAAGVPAILAALFGSSRFLVSGPTQPTALVLGVAVVAPVAAGGLLSVADAVVGIALLVGVFLAGLGLLGLGRASRFMSDSVVAGFTIGVGLLIAARHVPMMCDVQAAPLVTVAWVPTFWHFLADAIASLGSADARALALGIAVPAIIWGLRKVDARIPGALLALAFSAAVAWLLGWIEGEGALAVLVAVEVRAPTGSIPWAALPSLGPAALAVATLITVQSVAAARSLDVGEGPRLDADRELFAQGAANLAAAAVGAIPASGSLTRSALNRVVGARTRLAALVNGVTVALFLPFAGTVLATVPLAALGGLVVFSGVELIRPAMVRRAAATRGDGLVLVFTLVATLTLDLVQAVYAGLFLSLVLLIRRAGRLHLVEIVQIGPDRYRETPIDAETGTHPGVVLQLEGDLNFAVAPALSDQLQEIARRGPRVVIVRTRRARHLDATVVEVLRRLHTTLSGRGATLLLCGLSAANAQALARTELGESLGETGLIRSGDQLFEGFQRAMRAGRAQLADEPGPPFRTAEPVAWSYEI